MFSAGIISSSVRSGYMLVTDRKITINYQVDIADS